ncbi:hypothetical protein ABBQ38_003903 [Trebouxia sp. C0009 RCD-2024]
MLHLFSVGIHPKNEVNYQLWICSENKQNSISEDATFIFGPGGQYHGRRLIAWAQAVDPALGYLTEQQLTLGVHLQVQHEAFPKPLSNPLQQLTVFSQHYNAPMLSDIILAAEDQQIYAHKVVLASHSASFKAMFESGMQETTSQVVKIGQISASVLQAMVRFMYGDLVDIPHKMLVPLAVAADAHQVDVLRQTCLDQMLRSLSSNNILSFASVADQLHEQSLLEACLDKWAASMDSSEIVKSPEMANLMRDNTALAQELLARVMTHPTKKARTA